MPQVVFIMTDTQRKDMVGCYADTGLRTPRWTGSPARACASSARTPASPYAARPRRPVHRHLPPPQRRLGQLARTGRQCPDARPAHCGSRHPGGLHRQVAFGRQRLFRAGSRRAGLGPGLLVRHAQLSGGTDAGGARGLPLARAQPRPQPHRRFHLRPPLLRPCHPLPGTARRRRLPARALL